jgi:predicted ATPase
MRRIAEGPKSKYPQISPNDMKVYFCKSESGTSHAEELKINLFGSIENWPNDFFGDPFEEAAAREEAAIEKKAALK